MADHSGQYFGRYYLTERLGEGGMAVVYKAYDTRLERDIAIKIIRREAFSEEALEEVLKRFEREAKSLAKLSHPNIVKVHDFGEHEGSPYLVMEYLPGGTLKKLLGEPIPWQEAVRLILPVARGVSYAHQRGVLHRDIKPANVLITESGEPMLSDFGIAKMLEGEQTTALTGSGMAIGTPEYMAPEQWTGTTSPFSDQYSLGIVLYELVTGRKPYVADTPAAILIKQATEPLPSPRKFKSDLPESLEHVLLKTLAREPEDRYKNIDALIDALEGLRMDIPVAPAVEEEETVQETQLSPQLEPVVSIPTQLSSKDVEEPAKEEDVAGETHKSDGFIHPPEPAARKPASLKLSWRWTGFLVGGVILVLAAWLGIQVIDSWFSASPAPTPKPTVAHTSTAQQLSVPSSTTEPDQLPTEAIVPTQQEKTLLTEITDEKGVTSVLVPEGDFTAGMDANSAFAECQKYFAGCLQRWFTEYGRTKSIYLDDYYIDRYEATNASYKACVDAGACEPPKESSSFSHAVYFGNPAYANYPVVNIHKEQAREYCEWRGARLPTEQEWDKAARGTDGGFYPWGNDYDPSYANYGKTQKDTTEVGSYPKGASPYGIFDMLGNVWEWVDDPSVNDMDYVFMGGSWLDFGPLQRAAGAGPVNLWSFGVRCARKVTAGDYLNAAEISTPEPETSSNFIDSKGVEMVLVPESEFMMGSDSGIDSEKPVHRVYLDAYYIDKFEVTNALYKACVDAEICDGPTNVSRYNNSQYAQHPVVYVDWEMAKTYCEWRGARLPTEAEWEKAARGADGRTYPWGDEIDDTFANYNKNVGDTTPVGTYPKGVSPYGVYDMAGNVWEWVMDWYDGNYYAKSPDANPPGPERGDYRLLRGGSWVYSGEGARSAYRSWDLLWNSYDRLGFRCSRSP